MEPVVLAGEPPDPTRIPDGCRFHPRCPALASGEAPPRASPTTASGHPAGDAAVHEPHQSCHLVAAMLGAPTA